MMEQNRPHRDVLKTYFVDRGQSSAILNGDHHPDMKDRSCFSDALFRHSKHREQRTRKRATTKDTKMEVDELSNRMIAWA